MGTTRKIEELEGFTLHYNCNLQRDSTYLTCTVDGKFFHKRIFHGSGHGKYINVKRVPYNISGLFASVPISKERYF